MIHVHKKPGGQHFVPLLRMDNPILFDDVEDSDIFDESFSFLISQLDTSKDTTESDGLNLVADNSPEKIESDSVGRIVIDLPNEVTVNDPEQVVNAPERQAVIADEQIAQIPESHQVN